MAAGVSSVIKALSPDTKVIGVEPEGAPSMSEAMRLGYNLKLSEIDKFVDGAAVQQVGNLNFAICQKNVDRMARVAEGKICQTMLELYNKQAIVVEPAANWHGDFSCIYEVETGGIAPVQGELAVRVTPVNDPPRLSISESETPEDVAVETAIQVEDIDEDPVDLSILSASGGTCVVTSSDRVRFSPATNFVGEASCDVSATDAAGASSSAQWLIAVLSVNDAPL